MQFWTGLILGLILGWIIEWIIDWWYWRGGSGGSAINASYGSDLTRITGINSDYASRLNTSGVSSVSALASSSPSAVRTAIGGSEGKSIDAEAWIAEAGGLSGKASTPNLAASLTSGASSGTGSSGSAGLTSSSGSAGAGTGSGAGSSASGSGKASKPASGSASTGSGSAGSASSAGKGSSGSVGSAPSGAAGSASGGASGAVTSPTNKASGSAGSASGSSTGTKPASGSTSTGLGSASRAKPAASGSSSGSASSGKAAAGSGASSGAPRRDDLTKIHGVGKVFQGKFYDAGYTTWESVSKLSDAEIRRVIQPKDWQKIETDVWIEEARILAGGGTTAHATAKDGDRGKGDDLTKIHGIGKVYQGKFHDANIYLWSEIAELSDEKILAIIEPAEWQKIEPEEWKAEARQFAKEKGGDA